MRAPEHVQVLPRERAARTVLTPVPQADLQSLRLALDDRRHHRQGQGRGTGIEAVGVVSGIRRGDGVRGFPDFPRGDMREVEDPEPRQAPLTLEHGALAEQIASFEREGPQHHRFVHVLGAHHHVLAEVRLGSRRRREGDDHGMRLRAVALPRRHPRARVAVVAEEERHALAARGDELSIARRTRLHGRVADRGAHALGHRLEPADLDGLDEERCAFVDLDRQVHGVFGWREVDGHRRHARVRIAVIDVVAGDALQIDFEGLAVEVVRPRPRELAAGLRHEQPRQRAGLEGVVPLEGEARHLHIASLVAGDREETSQHAEEASESAGHDAGHLRYAGVMYFKMCSIAPRARRMAGTAKGPGGVVGRICSGAAQGDTWPEMQAPV